jgi:hypothetical protein
MSVNTATNAWYKMPRVKELQRIKMGFHPPLVLVRTGAHHLGFRQNIREDIS